MPADLSTTLQVCDLCIHGKQDCHPIPKVQEGKKVDKQLGQIFVDLSGPHSVASRSGFLYIMNIIDDFISKPWGLYKTLQ